MRVVPVSSKKLNGPLPFTWTWTIIRYPSRSLNWMVLGWLACPVKAVGKARVSSRKSRQTDHTRPERQHRSGKQHRTISQLTAILRFPSARRSHSMSAYCAKNVPLSLEQCLPTGSQLPRHNFAESAKLRRFKALHRKTRAGICRLRFRGLTPKRRRQLAEIQARRVTETGENAQAGVSKNTLTPARPSNFTCV